MGAEEGEEGKVDCCCQGRRDGREAEKEGDEALLVWGECCV